MELSTQQHAAALDYASLSAQIRRNRTEAKQEERVARLQELAAEHKALAAKAKNLRGEIEGHQKEARAAGFWPASVSSMNGMRASSARISLGSESDRM